MASVKICRAKTIQHYSVYLDGELKDKSFVIGYAIISLQFFCSTPHARFRVNGHLSATII